MQIKSITSYKGFIINYYTGEADFAIGPSKISDSTYLQVQKRVRWVIRSSFSRIINEIKGAIK